MIAYDGAGTREGRENIVSSSGTEMARSVPNQPTVLVIALDTYKYIHVLQGLKWNDSPCSFETYFICELWPVT